MDSKNSLVLMVAILVLANIAVLIYGFYIIEDVKNIEMDVNVKKEFAFNLDADKLHFGSIPEGAEGFRSFILRNKRNYPLKVDIIKKGEIAGWIELSENSFVMDPLENKTIKASIYPPQGAGGGLRNGTLKLVFKKSKII